MTMVVVNPNNRLKTELAAIEPPLWAGLIADYRSADILDAEAEDLTLDQTETYIREGGYKEVVIVVMGNNPAVSSTPKMPVAEALADRIRDLNVVFTGLHPIAVNYQKYPVLNKPFDGYPSIPFDQLPMERYRAHNWHCLDGSPRSPYATVYTSLGCPFNCYYCPVHTLYGNRQVGYRPVDDVLREIDLLVNRYKVKNIKIWDELFALSEDRVIAICSGLQGYDLNIWAYGRIDTITENMLTAMREAGIRWLAYGFEAMTDTKFIPETEEVIRMTKDAGINIIANFMFGSPGTTEKDDQDSLSFAKSHCFEFVNFYEAYPYPGSQWYMDAPLGSVWESYDQYGARRNQFRDKAFQDYFTYPPYLEMIEQKFGQQAVHQINTMLEWSPQKGVRGEG